MLIGCLPIMSKVLLNTLLYFPMRTLELTPAEAGLRYSEVQFEAEDRTSLHGWWIPGGGTPPLAHILYFHGNAGNVANRVPHARLLVDAGFDVFLFDYRGYGRSQGSPDEEGTYRDGQAARAALLRQPGVDPARILYLGESLGGAVAIALSLEAPPRGLILQSTFASVRDMARLHYPVVPGFLVPDAYPSLRRIGRLRSPVLFIHGDRDDIVPMSQGGALFAAAPEPKRFHVVEGAGHNDLVLVAGRSYGEIVANWVKGLTARGAPP